MPGITVLGICCSFINYSNHKPTWTMGTHLVIEDVRAFSPSLSSSDLGVRALRALHKVALRLHEEDDM